LHIPTLNPKSSAGFCSILTLLGSVLFWQCWVLFYSGSAGFCSILAVLGSVLFYGGSAGFCSILAVQMINQYNLYLFYYGTAGFCSIMTVLFYPGGAILFWQYRTELSTTSIEQNRQNENRIMK